MDAMTPSEINVSSAQKRNTKRTQRSSGKKKGRWLCFHQWEEKGRRLSCALYMPLHHCSTSLPLLAYLGLAVDVFFLGCRVLACCRRKLPRWMYSLSLWQPSSPFLTDGHDWGPGSPCMCKKDVAATTLKNGKVFAHITINRCHCDQRTPALAKKRRKTKDANQVEVRS